MKATQIIGLVLTASLAAIVFCIALNTRKGDLAALLRKPGLLFRSLLAMNVVLPAVAVLLAIAFKLNRQIEIALIALAVSPVPPILPNKLIKSGSSSSYAVGLLAFSAIVAIALIPITIDLIANIAGRDISIPPLMIVKAVGTSVLLPMIVGLLVRQFAPTLAARIVKPLSIVANVLLIAAFIPILVVAWPELKAQVGNFTLVAIILLVFAGLLAGHVLGGPDPGDRTALAVSTASRHPGIAIAVAGIIAPNDKSVVMAVLLAFLVTIIATTPYTKWRQRAYRESGAGT